MEHISEQKVQLDNIVLMPSFKYSMEYTIVPTFEKAENFINLCNNLLKDLGYMTS